MAGDSSKEPSRKTAEEEILQEVIGRPYSKHFVLWAVMGTMSILLVAGMILAVLVASGVIHLAIFMLLLGFFVGIPVGLLLIKINDEEEKWTKEQSLLVMDEDVSSENIIAKRQELNTVLFNAEKQQMDQYSKTFKPGAHLT